MTDKGIAHYKMMWKRRIPFNKINMLVKGIFCSELIIKSTSCKQLNRLRLLLPSISLLLVLF